MEKVCKSPTEQKRQKYWQKEIVIESFFFASLHLIKGSSVNFSLYLSLSPLARDGVITRQIYIANTRSERKREIPLQLAAACKRNECTQISELKSHTRVYTPTLICTHIYDRREKGSTIGSFSKEGALVIDMGELQRLHCLCIQPEYICGFFFSSFSRTLKARAI